MGGWVCYTTNHMVIDELCHNWLMYSSNRLRTFGYIEIDFETLECRAKQGSNHVHIATLSSKQAYLHQLFFQIIKNDSWTCNFLSFRRLYFCTVKQ